jgi:hypothetical protein
MSTALVPVARPPKPPMPAAQRQELI